MHILTKQAVEAISRKLHLSITGDEQDWDIKVASPDRIGEFLLLYQQDSTLNQPEKHALMALILASCDQALQGSKPIRVSDWKQIQALVYTVPANRDLFDYWARPGVDDVNQLFHLTPYLRSPA